MRVLLIILFLLFGSYNSLKAQETPPELETQRRYKAQSYFSGHIDYVYSYLNGTGGNERALFLKDYIQDLNNNGVVAEGGLMSRQGFSLGMSYDQFVSKRYALHYQFSYWQTGYREKLNSFLQDEFGQITKSNSLKANLNYIQLLSGLKYYNDYGITLTLAGFVNYNIVDKITTEESLKTNGSYGESDTSVTQKLYFHEYFGENRVVFLTGGAFSIGYKWNSIEIDASIKVTGPILDKIDDRIFNVYQLGFRYTIPTKRDDI